MLNPCISIRLPELLNDFEVVRIQETYRKLIHQLSKFDLLIIDDFLLTPVKESERSDILELMESRCNKHSTILCSQWVCEGRYRVLVKDLGILLQGISMREDYSKVK